MKSSGVGAAVASVGVRREESRTTRRSLVLASFGVSAVMGGRAVRRGLSVRMVLMPTAIAPLRERRAWTIWLERSLVMARGWPPGPAILLSAVWAHLRVT